MNDVENSASVSLVDAHTYNDFLASKCIADLPSGLDVSMDALSSTLFDFQAHLVRWAIRRGRAGLFTGTGTGKTAMQLAWCHTQEDSLFEVWSWDAFVKTLNKGII